MKLNRAAHAAHEPSHLDGLVGLDIQARDLGRLLEHSKRGTRASPCAVGVTGPTGAGKSTLVAAVARGMGFRAVNVGDGDVDGVAAVVGNGRIAKGQQTLGSKAAAPRTLLLLVDGAESVSDSVAKTVTEVALSRRCPVVIVWSDGTPTPQWAKPLLKPNCTVRVDALDAEGTLDAVRRHRPDVGANATAADLARFGKAFAGDPRRAVAALDAHGSAAQATVWGHGERQRAADVHALRQRIGHEPRLANAVAEIKNMSSHTWFDLLLLAQPNAPWQLPPRTTTSAIHDLTDARAARGPIATIGKADNDIATQCSGASEWPACAQGMRRLHAHAWDVPSALGGTAFRSASPPSASNKRKAGEVVVDVPVADLERLAKQARHVADVDVAVAQHAGGGTVAPLLALVLRGENKGRRDSKPSTTAAPKVPWRFRYHDGLRRGAFGVENVQNLNAFVHNAGLWTWALSGETTLSAMDSGNFSVPAALYPRFLSLLARVCVPGCHIVALSELRSPVARVFFDIDWKRDVAGADGPNTAAWEEAVSRGVCDAVNRCLDTESATPRERRCIVLGQTFGNAFGNGPDDIGKDDKTALHIVFSDLFATKQQQRWLCHAVRQELARRLPAASRRLEVDDTQSLRLPFSIKAVAVGRDKGKAGGKGSASQSGGGGRAQPWREREYERRWYDVRSVLQGATDGEACQTDDAETARLAPRATGSSTARREAVLLTASIRTDKAAPSPSLSLHRCIAAYGEPPTASNDDDGTAWATIDASEPLAQLVQQYAAAALLGDGSTTARVSRLARSPDGQVLVAEIDSRHCANIGRSHNSAGPRIVIRAANAPAATLGCTCRCRKHTCRTYRAPLALAVPPALLATAFPMAATANGWTTLGPAHPAVAAARAWVQQATSCHYRACNVRVSHPAEWRAGQPKRFLVRLTGDGSGHCFGIGKAHDGEGTAYFLVWPCTCPPRVELRCSDCRDYSSPDLARPDDALFATLVSSLQREHQ